MPASLRATARPPSIENSISPQTPTLVRYRSRTGIRSLRSSFELVEGEGVFDRLKIDCRVEISYPNLTALGDYVDHVSGRAGSSSVNLVSIETISNHKPKVRTVRPQGENWILSVVGDLIGGRQETGGIASLRLSIDLNVTRLIANQTEANLPFLGQLSPQELFLANAPEISAACAETCDGNSNILIGYARRGGTTFTHREVWNRGTTAIAIRGLHRLLAASFVPDDVNGLPPLRVEVKPLILTQAEVYWEFSSPAAISDVMTIADRMQMASGAIETRRYFPDAGNQAIVNQQNGVGMSIPLSDAVRVGIYSKTPNVVRLEVKYMKDVRDTVARQARGPQDINSILDRVRANGFGRLSKLKEAIVKVTPSISERADLLDFVRAIAHAADGDRRAEDSIFERLVNCASISETIDSGIASRPVCERLVRSGVIERVSVQHGGIRRYVLTAPYQTLLNTLHDARPNQIAFVAERATYPMQ